MDAVPSAPVFPPPKANEILTRIRQRYLASLPVPNGNAENGRQPQTPSQRIRYSPEEFEGDISNLIDLCFPFARISGPRLFSPARRLTHDFGVEVDNILHFRQNEVDHIVIIEAKKQKIEIAKGKWLVNYESGPKFADNQIENHIRTLWEYLEPFSRGIEVRFTGIVCSVDPGVKEDSKNVSRNSPIHLVPAQGLINILDRIFDFSGQQGLPKTQVLRVTQSAFLDLLRLSLPLKELGHPELTSAIRYVERCRRSLDQSLFSDFQPTSERWAINGSAGMGKSVLLGYAAVVFSSGFELANSLGDTFTIKADKTFERIGFSRNSAQSKISVIAMSAKQLENLKGWFDFFVEQFRKVDSGGEFRLQQPSFVLCRDAQTIAYESSKCSVMLVDEAHDLPAYAAREIAKSHVEKNFFLVVACDRHQKLRLSGDDARIMEGVDFRLKSRRLKQIYRNPAPVYIASLAIMFRWFAKDGPKVIPDIPQLKDSFGFEVKKDESGGLDLTIKSDAHPANSWCHTVATFPSAEAAYNALSRERLGHGEVLWVRFCEEDADFDYEKLRSFTYHNCRSFEAHKISDKYVKGQEYPVVVIEGFPGFMDRFEPVDGLPEYENKMWAFRREVYLSASRATCFLYFICNYSQETPEKKRLKQEIYDVVNAVSVPQDINTAGARTWKIKIEKSPETRRMDVFDDLSESHSEELDIAKAEVSESEPVTENIIFDLDLNPKNKISNSSLNDGNELKIHDQPQECKLSDRLVIKHILPITPKELAEELGVKPFQIIKDLMDRKKFASLKESLMEPILIKDICEKYDAVFEVISQENASTSSSTFEVSNSGNSTKSQHSPPVIAFKNSIVVDGKTTVSELALLLGVPSQKVADIARMRGYKGESSELLDLRAIRAIAAKNGLGVKIAQNISRLR
jgi:hypothetical protein